MIFKRFFLTPEERWSRRMARIERWSKPLNKRSERMAAWLHMVFVDHGFVRMVYLNEHIIAPTMRRAAQPMPYHIARWAREGVKTVINLRGGKDHGAWPLCRDACQRYGLDYVDMTLRSREAPDKKTLMELLALFESVKTPAVMHCKSGADRTGLAAALYLLSQPDMDLKKARRHLSLRYGHLRSAKTGILDAFLEAYALEGHANGLKLKDWIEHHYDQESLQKSFRPSLFANVLTDRLLRRE
jgi:protein tyrosine phosphatase (PTP) superfamily phosphohydrolase (DUF442 family)